jgi:hypothetical protein
MIAFCIRMTVKVLALAALTYCACFVKVGRFTPLEHAQRIAGTSEARELGGEVAGAVSRVKDKALQTVGNPVSSASPR